MPRYIDADGKVHIQIYDDMHEEYITVERTIASILDCYSDEGCPEAADVEEVKHGKWMDGKYFPFIPKKGTQGFQTATCSRCNITQSVNTYQEKVKFNYCPYCGARMDGKEKNDDNRRCDSKDTRS